MTDNTIEKIRAAEQEADNIVASAKKERTEAISSAKKDWDGKIESVRNESENVIAEKVGVASQEAVTIKSSREQDIKEKMIKIVENARGNIEEAVGFVVKKTLET